MGLNRLSCEGGRIRATAHSGPARSFTYIFPLGIVRFKSFSIAVWPYCLNALLTTTADEGLGMTAAWLGASVMTDVVIFYRCASTIV